MTDETTDPQTDETTDGAPYGVVPLLPAWKELVGRVEHLEASAPAEHPDDEPDEDDDEAATQARLSRHRGEIEEIKRTLNGVIEFLTVPGVDLPNQIPAAPVATTATPTSTPGAS